MKRSPKSAQDLVEKAFQLQSEGKTTEAGVLYREALKSEPSNLDALNQLGFLTNLAGQHEHAIGFFDQALTTHGRVAEVIANRGVALMELLRFEEAVQAFQEAVTLKPLAQFYNNLGVALVGMKRLGDAKTSYETALSMEPRHAQAHYNLANVLNDLSFYKEALTHIDKALEIRKNVSEDHFLCGALYQNLGNFDEAFKQYQKAIALAPENPNFHSMHLQLLNHVSSYSAKEIFDEHVRWGHKHADPLIPPSVSFPNPLDRDRKLRVGYVSPNFYNHVDASALQPFLSQHDRSQVEVHCYSSVRRSDFSTDAFQNMVEHWHDISKLNDGEAASQIRKDQIDILIELSGHTAGSRLLLFALRPAPILVSYLGYVNTTGLRVINYRITDEHGDPPGMTQPYYLEQQVHLPKTAFAYHPPLDGPQVSTLPAKETGQITFGSANHLGKLNEEVLALWARVLQAVPHSLLALKAKVLTIETERQALLSRFARHGIPADRLKLMGFMHSSLEFYQQIDIALDPFPFNGGTTSIESLWMGVPVVTLEGRSFVSRLGIRPLSLLQMKDWIASDVEGYVKIATEKAADLKALALLRGSLRERFRASPLIDGAGLARRLETAYRAMWWAWCRKNGK